MKRSKKDKSAPAGQSEAGAAPGSKTPVMSSGGKGSSGVGKSGSGTPSSSTGAQINSPSTGNTAATATEHADPSTGQAVKPKAIESEEVEDVVRSGIVSRILASVSGRAEQPHPSPYPSAADTRTHPGSKTDPLLKGNHAQKETALANNMNANPSGPTSIASSGAVAATKTSTTHKDAPSHNKPSVVAQSEIGSSPSTESSTRLHDRLDSATTVPHASQPSGAGKSGVPDHVGTSSPRGGEQGGNKDTLQPNSDTHSPETSGKSKSPSMGNQAGQIYSPSSSKSNVPLSAQTKRDSITAEIPQSLSADSGIGSPTDAHIIGIDPAGKQDGGASSTEDKKKKGEESPAGGSSTPQIVSPDLAGPAENYPPPKGSRGAAALSASSDTSNYRPVPATKAETASRASRPSTHESHRETSLRSNQDKQLAPTNDLGSQAEESTASIAKSHLPSPDIQATKSEHPDTAVSPKTLRESDLPSGAVTVGTRAENSEDTGKDAVGGESDKVTFRLDSVQPSGVSLESANVQTDQCPGDSEVNTRPLSPSDIEAVIDKSLTSVDETAAEKDNSKDGAEDKQRSANLTTAVTVDERDDDKIQTKDGRSVTSSAEPQTADGNSKLPVKTKASFRDVNLQEVIALSDSPNTDRKIKGILKIKSAPILHSSEASDRRVASSPVVEIKNGGTKDGLASSRSVSFKKTHTKNTFSYYNAAFEGEIITEPSKRPSLADVVTQIMRQNIIDIEDDNSHPYGRDSSLTDLMTGKRSDHHKVDAGKMIVWLALAIMIVSLAGGIIFMSETYNLSHRNDGIVLPDSDTTTLGRSS